MLALLFPEEIMEQKPKQPETPVKHMNLKAENRKTRFY